MCDEHFSYRGEAGWRRTMLTTMVMLESINTSTEMGRFLLRAYARSAANPDPRTMSAKDTRSQLEDVPAHGKYCIVSTTSSRIEVYTQLQTGAVSVDACQSGSRRTSVNTSAQRE